MNEAVVKFYKSGQTTTGALKQSLMLLKNQVAAAADHFWSFLVTVLTVRLWTVVDVARCCSGCPRLLSSVGVLQVHTTADDADALDDVENSLLYHNQAIIHYYLRQFSEAISIGERLYQFLEPFGRLGSSSFCCILTCSRHAGVVPLALLPSFKLIGSNVNVRNGPVCEAGLQAGRERHRCLLQGEQLLDKHGPVLSRSRCFPPVRGLWAC